MKYPILSCRTCPAFFPAKFASLFEADWRGILGRKLRQASNSVRAARPAIDLKLRLALRVAALAAVCFIAVAAYALFDSDRVAKAKASRIAEIVARDLSLQQSQAKWLSVSIERDAGSCRASRR